MRLGASSGACPMNASWGAGRRRCRAAGRVAKCHPRRALRHAWPPTGSQPCPHHSAARHITLLHARLCKECWLAYPRGRTNMTATRSFRRYVLPPALRVMVRRTASARLTCDRAYSRLSKE